MCFVFVFVFLKILFIFIYLREIASERAKEREHKQGGTAEGEADSLLSREPNTGS